MVISRTSGERLVAIEVEVKSMKDLLKQYIEKTDKRIELLEETKASKSSVDDIKKLLYWAIGIAFTTMISVLMYISVELFKRMLS